MNITSFEPMNSGQVIDRVFRIYFNNFGLMAGIVAVPVFFAFLVSVIQLTVIPGFGDPTQFSFTQFWITIPLSLLSMMLFSVSNGATTIAVSSRYLDRDISIPAAYQQTFERLIPFLLTHIIVGIFVIVGFIFCLIPGIFLAVCFALITPVFILEKLGISDSIQRSWDLLKDFRLDAFVVLLLMWVILFGVGIASSVLETIVMSMVGYSTMTMMVLMLVNSIIQLLSTPLLTITCTLLYYNTRIKKEGYDLELLASDLSGGGLSYSYHAPSEGSSSGLDEDDDFTGGTR